MPVGILTLYIITAVLSIIIASFLVRFAMLSGHAKIKAEIEKSKAAETQTDDTGQKPFHERIAEEINKLADSTQRRQQTSQKVLDIVEQALEERARYAHKELSQKYDKGNNCEH